VELNNNIILVIKSKALFSRREEMGITYLNEWKQAGGQAGCCNGAWTAAAAAVKP